MFDFINWPPSWSTLLLIPALVVGFTVHELAHALVAFMLGDTSQVELKRLTFNPVRHISWVGMAAFLIVGFGWAKPVWVDYKRLRIKNRPLGMFLVAIAGATANLLTALFTFAGMSLSMGIAWAITGAPIQDLMVILAPQEPALDLQGLAVALSTYMVMVNLILAFFNMLPLPSMDGFQALISLWAVIRNAVKGTQEEVSFFPRRPTGSPPKPKEEPAETPAQLHFSIGLEYHKEGQMDEAIARYRQAIAHDEDLALAYYNQGLAYWAKGRPSLAANAFRAAAGSGDDMNVRVQASQRLQELAQADQDLEAELPPLPPPLDPQAALDLSITAQPTLDPEVARQVWLRLGIGGALMFVLALGMWFVVTAALIVLLA